MSIVGPGSAGFNPETAENLEDVRINTDNREEKRSNQPTDGEAIRCEGYAG
jgi:hypothetical protein